MFHNLYACLSIDSITFIKSNNISNRHNSFLYCIHPSICMLTIPLIFIFITTYSESWSSKFTFKIEKKNKFCLSTLYIHHNKDLHSTCKWSEFILTFNGFQGCKYIVFHLIKKNLLWIAFCIHVLFIILLQTRIGYTSAGVFFLLVLLVILLKIPHEWCYFTISLY